MPGGGDDAAGVAADADGRLQLFLVDSWGGHLYQIGQVSGAIDGNIYHKWQTVAGNGWGPWTLLAPQDPSLITTVPDLIGLSVAHAHEQVQAAQLHLTAHGSGNWVGNQPPEGGTVVPVGSTVSVGLVVNPP